MPLISLTNRIIRQNPAVRDMLAGYNGLVFAVRAGGLQLRGRFTADGLLEACGRPADAVLVLRPSLIDAVFDGRRPGFGDIAVEGDLPLGFNLLAAFSGLRLSAADLRQILAEAAASPSAERAAAAVKQAAERFAVPRQTAAVSRAEFDEALDEIARLRCELERVQARLRSREEDER